MGIGISSCCSASDGARIGIDSFVGGSITGSRDPRVTATVVAVRLADWLAESFLSLFVQRVGSLFQPFGKILGNAGGLTWARMDLSGVGQPCAASSLARARCGGSFGFNTGTSAAPMAWQD